MTPLKLKRGDYVRVRAAGKDVTAFVMLASENGRSLIVAFDAMIGGYAGTMPLTWKDGYFGLIDMMPVELEVQPE